MLVRGIPVYRLPKVDVEAELAFLPKMGVKTELGTRIGEDITLAQLREENYAVLLATGRWMGKKFGPTTPEIEPAISFLWDAKSREDKKVVVIGGGAVAMDCAMTAPRLGADTTLVALEQRDAMLAPEHEIEEAVEDGVKLLNGWSVKEFVIENGKLTKLILQRCLRVFDRD